MISVEEILIYKTIIDDLNVVFDVGCQHDNVFDELKPGIEIHMFDPVISARLQDKIKGKANIHYNDFALGSEFGFIPFHYSYGSFLKREDDPKLTDHSSIIVEVRTVAEYCKLKGINKIDLLKIDTEGYDFEVIVGCQNMLKRIKYIQFEHWSDEMVKKILDYLPKHELVTIHSKPINYIAIL
jgi:FkbM family methyltransferase